jgi:hypothetical protein
MKIRFLLAIAIALSAGFTGYEINKLQIQSICESKDEFIFVNGKQYSCFTQSQLKDLVDYIVAHAGTPT